MLIKVVLLPVIFIIALVIGVVLNAALRRKRVQWLPERRPWFCVLPKYCMNLELTGREDVWEDEVHQRITQLGFKLTDDNDRFRSYERGHDYADFSADAIRIAIVVRRPINNPAVIGLQYASRFGAAFDTGDLWKVADSIRTSLVSSSEHRTCSTMTGDGDVTESRNYHSWLIPLFAVSGVLVIVLGVVLALKVASSDRIYAEGQLQPTVQQDVYSPEDAIIGNIFVERGKFFRKETPLLGLRNEEYESQQAELFRQLEEQQRSLSTVMQLRFSKNLDVEQGMRLTQESHEFQSSIKSIKSAIEAVEKNIESLTVRSPFDGELIAQADGLMAGRSVRRGDYLLTIADLNGSWRLNLPLDEAQTGSLLRAQASASEPLAVRFLLGTDSQWGQSTIASVSRSAKTPSVQVAVEIDVAQIPSELLIPGTPVKAVILLRPN